ncbi:hypothetical protein GQ607_002384 [Colletotrichum asianum]|uniref:Uncharacterized protein n=1 Tax=Colletotrichum asianum TaxID=702518 RepID=A0A8H3ZYG0_9PEZI|nr:hypothetical protein GQ607_002384 [Colletotrichum asianum]
MIDFEPTCQGPRWEWAEDYTSNVWDKWIEGDILTRDKPVLQEISKHMETDGYIEELSALFNKSPDFFDGVTTRLISTLFAWEQMLYEKERWDAVNPSDKSACERFLNGRRLSSDTGQDVKKRNRASLIMLKVVAPRVYGPCIASIGALSVTAGRFKKEIAKCEVTKNIMSKKPTGGMASNPDNPFRTRPGAFVKASEPKSNAKQSIFDNPFRAEPGAFVKASEPDSKPHFLTAANVFGLNKPSKFATEQELKPKPVKNPNRKRAEVSEDEIERATHRQRGKTAVPPNRLIKSPVLSDTLEESDGGSSTESESTSAQNNEVNEIHDKMTKMKLVRGRRRGKEAAQRNHSKDGFGAGAYQTSDGVKGKWFKRTGNIPGKSTQGRPGKLRKKGIESADKKGRELQRNPVKQEDDEESESDSEDNSDGGAKLLPHPGGSEVSELSDEGLGLSTPESGESSELSDSDEFDRAKVKQESSEDENMGEPVHAPSVSARRRQSGRKRQRSHADDNGPAKRQKSVSYMGKPDEFDRAKVKRESSEDEDMGESIHDPSISARGPQSGRKRQRSHADDNGPAKRQKSVSFKEVAQETQGLRKRRRE